MNTKQIRTLVVIGLVIVIGGSIVLFYGKTLLPTQSEETSSLTTLDTTDKSINSVGDENADKNRAANEESTAVTPKTAQEDAALALAVLGGKGDVGHDDVVGLDLEALAAVGAAEGAFVVGAAHGDLQQYGVGLAGGPDDVAFVVHIFYYSFECFLLVDNSPAQSGNRSAPPSAE